MLPPWEGDCCAGGQLQTLPLPPSPASGVRQKVVPLPSASRIFTAGSKSSQRVATSKQSPATITCCSGDRPALPVSTHSAIFMHSSEPEAHGIFAGNDESGQTFISFGGPKARVTLRRKSRLSHLFPVEACVGNPVIP